MKLRIIGILISLVFILVQCKMQSKVLYEFPPTMLADVKVEYIKQFEKGKILYDINCAKCHTKKENNKDIVPDFTSLQLVNYEMRILNPEHQMEVSEMRVAEDELAVIITYLKYKKKNN